VGQHHYLMENDTMTTLTRPIYTANNAALGVCASIYLRDDLRYAITLTDTDSGLVASSILLRDCLADAIAAADRVAGFTGAAILNAFTPA